MSAEKARVQEAAQEMMDLNERTKIYDHRFEQCLEVTNRFGKWYQVTQCVCAHRKFLHEMVEAHHRLNMGDG